MFREKLPYSTKSGKSKSEGSNGEGSTPTEYKKIDRKMSWNVFITYENKARIRSTKNNRFMYADGKEAISFKSYDKENSLFEIISVDEYEKAGKERGQDDQDDQEWAKPGLTDNHKKFLENLEKEIIEGKK